jgi:hypothetical protein
MFGIISFSLEDSENFLRNDKDTINLRKEPWKKAEPD